MFSGFWQWMVSTFLDPAGQVQAAVSLFMWLVYWGSWLVPGVSDFIQPVLAWSKGPAIPAMYACAYFFVDCIMPVSAFRMGLYVFQTSWILSSVFKLIMLIKGHVWHTPNN